VTITDEDLEQFGSKGSLNAFLILQLAADYLISECERLESESQTGLPTSAAAFASQIEEFNREIQSANTTIAEKDATIADLTRRIRAHHEANAKEKRLLEGYRNQLRQLKAHHRPPPPSSGSEPGQIRDVSKGRRAQQKQKPKPKPQPKPEARPKPAMKSSEIRELEIGRPVMDQSDSLSGSNSF
jgi:chromosome segregation ATPase